MLDADTKRRIDTARDILVGKVPDPKSQVEQITIALIYKFMDDMDAEAEEFGGKRKFFAGEFERYGWAKLMRSGLGGHEMLGLYGEAIVKMPENPGIPLLFRDIFKNAYLPYRDPETLRAFLKIIDEFYYDHSEKLGDAYEYLLSVLGSQGNAGQFRTPRHIIDFIVDVIDPKKTDTILDPACGSAGFLISSYKHILANNRVNIDVQDKKDGNKSCTSCSSMSVSSLTPDERGRLAKNITGYDIDPLMVRLSLVNLYLHGFADPHIHEYDSLSRQERWNETADVILANPPFMSPKGGITPHNRFTVKSKRSEVLFVDYIAEHLRPNGRAGIIVPEGVIFQSQTAYKQLRKNLVEDYLVAVVSLPAGVFQPYSGVKTSILIFDKALAKKSDSIAFVKIEQDGFGLGAQRRAIERNDLPDARKALREYLNMDKQDIQDKNSKSCPSCTSMLNVLIESGRILIVPKTKIAENGDYNLSGERYREAINHADLKWPLVAIGELCVVERGASPRPIRNFITNDPNGVNWVKIGDAGVGSKYITSTKQKVTPEGATKSRRVKPGDFVLSNSMSFGRPYVMATEGCIHDGWLLLRDQSERLDQNFLYHILGSNHVFSQFKQAATGGVVNNLNSEIVRGVKIPLPPLEIQQEIVAEIEGYQNVIDGARAVLDHYRPHIPIHPNWPMVELQKICQIKSGSTPSRSNENYWNGGTFPWITTTQIKYENITQASEFITEEGLKNSSCWLVPAGTVLMAMYGQGQTRGRVGLLKIEAAINQACAAFLPNDEIIPDYLYWSLAGAYDELRRISDARGGNQGNLSATVLKAFQIPLPPLAEQQAIVAEIEAEQALVNANRELITRMEAKIQSVLSRIWGEKEE